MVLYLIMIFKHPINTWTFTLCNNTFSILFLFLLFLHHHPQGKVWSGFGLERTCVPPPGFPDSFAIRLCRINLTYCFCSASSFLLVVTWSILSCPLRDAASSLRLVLNLRDSIKDTHGLTMLERVYDSLHYAFLKSIKTEQNCTSPGL